MVGQGSPHYCPLKFHRRHLILQILFLTLGVFHLSISSLLDFIRIPAELVLAHVITLGGVAHVITLGGVTALSRMWAFPRLRVLPHWCFG